MAATTMTINLRKSLLRLHTVRRRKRAAALVKEAVARYSKSDIEKVKIGKELNEFIAKNASGASFMWAKLALSIEKAENRVDVKLHVDKQAQEKKPEAAKPEEKKAKAEKAAAPAKKEKADAKAEKPAKESKEAKAPKEPKEAKQQKQA